MTKFRTRLLFTLLTLFSIVIVGLGLLLGELFKNYYLNTIDERPRKRECSIATSIEDSGGVASIQYDRLTDFSKKLDVRLSIIDRDGVVLYDSDLNSNELKDISKRIIKSDEENKNGFKVIDQSNVHYYWEPILHNGQNEGFLLLSTKMSELKKAYQQIWWILTISFGLAFVIILFLGSKITNRYTKPIERATNVAFELAKGNYRARTYEDDNLRRLGC